MAIVRDIGMLELHPFLEGREECCIQLTVRIGEEGGETLPETLWTTEVVKALVFTVCGRKARAVELVDESRALIAFHRATQLEKSRGQLENLKAWLNLPCRAEAVVLSEEDTAEIMIRKEGEAVVATVAPSATLLVRGGGGETEVPVTPTAPSNPFYLPKLPVFTSNEATGKDAVSYAHWRYSLKSLTGQYSETILKQAIVASLRGPAADVVRYREGQTVDECLEELDVWNDVHYEYAVLLKIFNNINQEKGESVAAYALRLEKALDDLTTHHPEMMDKDRGRREIRHMFYQGLEKTIRDSVRYEFRDKKVSYHQLIREARSSEGDGPVSAPRPTVRSKMVRPADVGEVPDETPKGDEAPEGDQTLMTTLLQELVTIKSAMAAPYRGRGGGRGGRGGSAGRGRAQEGTKCFRCNGYGHYARECATPDPKALNDLGGETPSESTPPAPAAGQTLVQ